MSGRFIYFELYYYFTYYIKKKNNFTYLLVLTYSQTKMVTPDTTNVM